MNLTFSFSSKISGVYDTLPLFFKCFWPNSIAKLTSGKQKLTIKLPNLYWEITSTIPSNNFFNVSPKTIDRILVNKILWFLLSRINSCNELELFLQAYLTFTYPNKWKITINRR